MVGLRLAVPHLAPRGDGCRVDARQSAAVRRRHPLPAADVGEAGESVTIDASVAIEYGQNPIDGCSRKAAVSEQAERHDD